MSQHTSELENMLKQRNDLDEKYKNDLIERDSREIHTTTSLKRENLANLNKVQAELKENNDELSRIIEENLNKRREED